MASFYEWPPQPTLIKCLGLKVTFIMRSYYAVLRVERRVGKIRILLDVFISREPLIANIFEDIRIPSKTDWQ